MIQLPRKAGGGPRGQVRIELHAGDKLASVRIYDSGPGVPPQIAERLFEPFTTGKPEGIGLGLTVARQIAEAHGGRIGAANRVAADGRIEDAARWRSNRHRHAR